MNTALQDDRLSLRARGLLALVLSLPPTWEHAADRLAGMSREGVDAVRGALRELVTLGYAEIRKTRGQGGRVISRWHFVECPPDAKKPDPVAPDAILPGAGKTPPSETTVVETTVERMERGERSPTAKAAGAHAVVMPLPKSAEDVAAFAEGAGYYSEQGAAFWNMMTARGWKIRGRNVRDWKKALSAWCEKDVARKHKRDGINHAEFWAFVREGDYSEDAANDFIQLVNKNGRRITNRLTGRLEPVRDYRAAFKAFVESDLNQDLERVGAR